MKRIFWLLLPSMFAITSFAKENKISQSQAIMVELRDPTEEAEKVMIRVKELESGKVTQLSLEKDPSSSQVWSGYFIIQFFKGDSSARTLDFQASTGAAFFADVSQSKAVQRVILFKTPEELAIYEASISEETQKAAEKRIAMQIQVARPRGTGTAPLNKEKLEQLVRQQGQQQEASQMAQEEMQTKKRMALLVQHEKMTMAQKKLKREQAAEIVKKADALYAVRKYKEAEGQYVQAIELDPESESYYYRYGVSLYKIGNYNKSLAILSLVEVDSDVALEKNYYVALNHLKLKDYDKALKELIELRDEKSPELSPMASFFAGNIEFQQQKFPAARKSMEFVLDNSKNPQLDRSADEMLEQIDRMETYYESKKERYRLVLFGGPSYDSNVLNIAENNISTDVKSLRLYYGASALAILHRTPTSDLGAQLSFSDYYSMNSSLKSDPNLQIADAMEFGISLPYHQEIKVSKRQMNLELTPSYKNIYLAPAGGTREIAVRSTDLISTLSTAIKQDLYLSGRLNFGLDESVLASSIGDDDLSGTRYGVTFIPTKLLDLKGEKTLSGEIGYLFNNAKGINNRYQRVGIAGVYGFPTFYKGTGSLRADFSLQDYKDATTPRKDTNMIFTGAYNKDLSKKWNMLLSLQLTSANSEVDVYRYNKYLIMGLFTYTTSILQK